MVNAWKSYDDNSVVYLFDARLSNSRSAQCERREADLHQTVVGVGDVVGAADRSKRRRTVAAAATFDVTRGRNDHTLAPVRAKHRLTRICAHTHAQPTSQHLPR